MFGLWNKKNKYTRPESLTSIISAADYNELVALCLDYFKQNNIEVKKVDDGIIYTVIGENEVESALDNLTRALVQREKKLWPEEISNHFGKLKNNEAAYSYFFDDFEEAKQYLKIIIKPQGILPADQEEKFIWRTDFPSTQTFLVFDFEEKFTYLTYEQVEKWQQPGAHLFEIALQNVAREEITVREAYLEDKYKIVVLLSGDFSAAHAVDLRGNAGLTIGKYGSLVAIPTKGTVFIHPIDEKHVQVIPALYEEVVRFYNEDPGNITPSLFWFDGERYHVFPEQEQNGTITFSLPGSLKELFGT